MENYLRRFISEHSFEQAMESILHPPQCVVESTAAFLSEAETGVPVDRECPDTAVGQSTDSGRAKSDELAAKVHAAILTIVPRSVRQYQRWPPYTTRAQVLRCSAIPGSKRELRMKRSKNERSKWQARYM